MYIYILLKYSYLYILLYMYKRMYTLFLKIASYYFKTNFQKFKKMKFPLEVLK